MNANVPQWFVKRLGVQACARSWKYMGTGNEPTKNSTPFARRPGADGPQRLRTTQTLVSPVSQGVKPCPCGAKYSENCTTAPRVKTPDFDSVRSKYLLKLYGHTGRDVILYASAWLQKDAPPEFTTIVDEDIHALMEVTAGLKGPCVNLILHSPGGSPVAAEAIVSYWRSRFSHIRAIVSQLAMSAATMISYAADEDRNK